MCELCEPGLFCVEMAESIAGVLCKNKRIVLLKVLLVMVNDHCGQKPGRVSQPLEPSLLGICLVGMALNSLLSFPVFYGSSLLSLLSCLASEI